MNLNRVLIVGRATRDAETKYLPSGSSVTNLSLAVNERYQDKAGEWKEDVSFVDVVLWGKASERAAETVRKGTSVFVEGKLKQESWEQDGQKRSKLKVSANQFFAMTAGAEPPDTGRDSGKAKAPPRGANPPSDALDFGSAPTATRDDCPF